MQVKPLSKAELEARLKDMMEHNFYEILKLIPLASQDEVHQAFHKEAVLYHPDLFSQESELKEISLHIYETLVDAYRTLSY